MASAVASSAGVQPPSSRTGRRQPRGPRPEGWGCSSVPDRTSVISDPPKTSRPAFAGRLSTRCTRQQKMRFGGGPCSFAPSKTPPVPASPGRFRDRRLLSWGQRPFQRSYRRAVARHWFRAPPPPFATEVAAALGSSKLTGGASKSKTSAHRLSEGWPPLQSMTGPACRSPLGHGASQEFLPLQRMRMREPTHPGFASSRFGCGCRVSHPLAAFRLPRPSDRLRPVTLMGFSPSKLLPPDGAVAPLDAPLPSCRCPHSVPVA